MKSDELKRLQSEIMNDTRVIYLTTLRSDAYVKSKPTLVFEDGNYVTTTIDQESLKTITEIDAMIDVRIKDIIKKHKTK